MYRIDTLIVQNGIFGSFYEIPDFLEKKRAESNKMRRMN